MSNANNIAEINGVQIISNKSLWQLQHTFNLIGRRILPCYFFTHNHQEMIRWQFNACRQTAVICAYFLDQLAENIKERHWLEISVNAWDSNFKSLYDKEYNHAWAYLNAHDRPDEFSSGLFVDVSRISYPTVVAWGTNDPDSIFSRRVLSPWEGSVVFQETGPRECMPWKDLLDEKEFYTQKTGWEICSDIEKLLNLYSFDFHTFDILQ